MFFFLFFVFTIDSNYSYELQSLLTYRYLFSVIVKQVKKYTQSVARMSHKYLSQLLYGTLVYLIDPLFRASKGISNLMHLVAM